MTVIPFECDYKDRASMWGDPVKAPVFNINGLDDARAYAETQPWVVWTFDPAFLDVRMPEAFVFDKARHTVEWAANTVIDAIARDIRKMSDPVVMKWMDARRSLMMGKLISGSDDRIAEITSDLMHHVKSASTARHVDEMLRLWSESDIALEVGGPLPGP